MHETNTATTPYNITTGKTVFETVAIPTTEKTLVEKVNAKAAELWDLFNEGTNAPGTEGGRMYAIAKTKLEESVMWFNKGVTRSKANNA